MSPVCRPHTSSLERFTKNIYHGEHSRVARWNQSLEPFYFASEGGRCPGRWAICVYLWGGSFRAEAVGNIRILSPVSLRLCLKVS